MKQSKMDRGNGEVKHKTEDERKTKVQLIGELAEMRQRIVELATHAKQIEPVLTDRDYPYFKDQSQVVSLPEDHSDVIQIRTKLRE